MPQMTRRELIRWIGGAAAAAKLLPACGDNAGDAVFSAGELRVLRGFADVVIPPDDKPGGAALGAVEYIEGLLRAFDVIQPRIYAGGPFSDRHPFADATGQASDAYPPNDFVHFIELDRVTAVAWQRAIADTDKTLRDGIAGVIAASPKQIEDFTHDDFVTAFDGADPAFRDLMIELVVQAAFAAPEYGGNPGREGWRMIHFEGDSQPLGYSQWDGAEHVERPEAPLSGPNPSDPEPMTDDVRQLIALVIGVLGGRVA